jgi:hypothetical protein
MPRWNLLPSVLVSIPSSTATNRPPASRIALTASCTCVDPPSQNVNVSYANRNKTKHIPYGEGTLRAEPLAEALARFERPATVITESPDEASHQAVRAVLLGERVARP